MEGSAKSSAVTMHGVSFMVGSLPGLGEALGFVEK
jgi:hypothetical protein